VGNAQKVLTEHEALFDQWWGRHVMDLTDEEIAAGGASLPAMRAMEAAWKASAFVLVRRAGTGRRRRTGRTQA
jgi:hypothetical protein